MNCYQRQRNRGTLERVHFPRAGKCSVDGCEKKVDAKGLCSRHYAQDQDPRRNTWKLLRSRWPGEFPPSWASFKAFCADVGEKPSTRHQLRRPNITEPYSKENVEWLAPVNAEPNSLNKEEKAYRRAWLYGKHYKLSMAQHSEMLAAQGGVCAICKKAESVTVRKKVRELCVDHCHETGRVRGLLCARCNRGIGYLGDDPERLRSALDYLLTK